MHAFTLSHFRRVFPQSKLLPQPFHRDDPYFCARAEDDSASATAYFYYDGRCELELRSPSFVDRRPIVTAGDFLEAAHQFLRVLQRAAA